MRAPIRFAAPAVALLLLGGAIGAWHAHAATRPSEPSLERGRYLVKIAGCNDCHTAGYANAGGKVPESEWLKGDPVGWRGPWGTTYAANLRLVMATMTEDEWVRVAARAQYRPPMPWFALHDMEEADLRAIHRYVRALGAAGEPAPAWVPPGREPAGPFIAFPMGPKP